MGTPSTIDPKMIAEALKLQKEQDELRTRGLDKIGEERDLMVEMENISKKIGVNFNVHSKNIGSAVVEMSKLDRIGSIIESRSKENYSLESNYIDLLKEQSSLKKENSMLLNERDELQIKIKSEILSVENELEDLKEKEIRGERDVTDEYEQQLVKLKQLKDEEAAVLEVAEDLIKVNDDFLNSREDLLKNTADEIENNRIIIKQHQELAYQLKLFVGMAESLLPILGKTGNEFVTIGKNIVEAYKNGNLLGAAMAAVTEYLKIGVERFSELQVSAEKFRKDTGLTLSQTSAISQYVKQLNANYQSMGVSLEAAYDSAKELMSELGNSKVLDNNKSLIQTSSLLVANYGVAAADAAGFQLSMMRAGENSAASAENMSAVAIKMSDAAGVSLPQVMKNVASASGTTLAMVRGSNVELVKAAVHAKRFGVELETISTAARRSLNFYESITDEMEASVLVGHQLSFQSARERAFAGDMVGFQNEILKTVGSIDKFGERSIFEQEAVAKAAGIELKELKKMLQVEEQLKKLSSSERAEYDLLLKSNAKITEEDGKQLLKKQQIQNQLTRINNSFTAIKNKIGDSLQPALEIVADLIVWIADLMGGVSKSTEDTGEKSTSVWKSVTFVILAAAAGIGLLVASLKIASFLSLGLGKTFQALAKAIGTGITSIMTTIGTGITSIGTALKSLSGGAAIGAAVLVGIMLGLAASIYIVSKAVKELSDTRFSLDELLKGAVVGIGALIAVLLTLSKTLPLIGNALTSLGKTAGNPAALKGLAIFAAVMFTVSLTAMALGWSAKMIGDGFKSAGEGAKSFADSLFKLAEIGFIKLSLGLYNISGSIVALALSLAAMSVSGTPKFLNDLVSMSASLLPVASALEKIANALERISNIKSFPKLEIPEVNSTGTTTSTDGNGKSYTDIVNRVDGLTASVNNLVEYMRNGGVIANTYLDARLVSKELGIYNASRNVNA